MTEPNPQDITPRPDPTKLTTDAVSAATEQWRRDLTALRETIDARLDAMDKATDLRLNTLRDAPHLWEREVAHLSELITEKFAAINEKFNSIGLQFLERDIRSTQASAASSEALAAALQAAKELVGAQGEASAAAAVKAETSFTKQIDQIGVLVAGLDKSMSDRTSTVEKSLTDRILELKERIDRGEGQGQGVNNAHLEHSASARDRVMANGLFVAAAAVIVSLAGIVVAVIVARH